MTALQEIKTLRQSGQLKAAYVKADQLLASDPDDLYFLRAKAWVLYAYLKRNAKMSNGKAFLKCLKQLQSLDLPNDEALLFEKIYWQIATLFFDLARHQSTDLILSQSISFYTKSFPLNRKSKVFSYYLSALVKLSKHQPLVPIFVEQAKVEDFSKHDFEKNIYKGKNIPSLVERFCGAYTKAHIHTFQHGDKRADLTSVVSFLKDLIHKGTDFRFTKYYLAMAYLEMGDLKQARSIYKDFLLANQREFWAWSFYAKLFESNEMQIACLAKALLCKKPEAYVIKVRETLAELLIKSNFLKAAKVEIERIKQTRKDQNWKDSVKVIEWENSEWYSIVAKGSNIEQYKKWAVPAVESILEECKAEIGVISFVNEGKNLAGFVIDQSTTGVFKINQFGLKNLSAGISIELKLLKTVAGKPYNILSVKRTETPPSVDLVRNFGGFVQKRPKWPFAIADDVYISPVIVKKHKVHDGQMLFGKAHINYNKTKDIWSWMAFEID